MALLDLIPTTRTPLRMTELKVVAQHINFKVRPWRLRRFQLALHRALIPPPQLSRGVAWPMRSCAGCKS